MKPISRRDMLNRTGLLAAAAATTLPASQTAADPDAGAAHEPKQKLKVIVTGGHPGDPEYGCGGTIARYSNLGHEVVLLYLNRGEGNDKNKVRVAEANKACEILKARALFAGQIDGKAVVDQARYDAFHQLLKAQSPDIVFTHWPIDSHVDHRAMSMLVYEAWLRMKRGFALYYYEVSNGEDTVQFTPSHYVDITETESRKRDACYAHASQAPDKFYALQQLVMRMRGVESGYKQAEGFIRHVQSPDFALPMTS